MAMPANRSRGWSQWLALQRAPCSQAPTQLRDQRFTLASHRLPGTVCPVAHATRVVAVEGQAWAVTQRALQPQRHDLWVAAVAGDGSVDEPLSQHLQVVVSVGVCEVHGAPQFCGGG